jgi:hypothetical protein
VGLAKLPIGALTTILLGQLSHPYAGGPIKQPGLGAKLYNYQSSIVAQNYHCNSPKTCFSNRKAALASALASAPPVVTFTDSLCGRPSRHNSIKLSGRHCCHNYDSLCDGLCCYDRCAFGLLQLQGYSGPQLRIYDRCQYTKGFPVPNQPW